MRRGDADLQRSEVGRAPGEAEVKPSVTVGSTIPRSTAAEPGRKRKSRSSAS